MESRREVPFWIIVALMVLVISGLVYLLFGSPQADKVETVGTSVVRVDTPVKTQPRTAANFTDGLSSPHEISTYKLDETGAGIASKAVFYHDINGDGVSDRITRSRYENGTSHFWDSYTIELIQDGKYHNIAPENFRTTHGAECALTQIQFSFKPTFQVVKISRPWQESWNTPSVATRTVYRLKNNELIVSSQDKLGSVCDVTELF